MSFDNILLSLLFICISFSCFFIVVGLVLIGLIVVSFLWVFCMYLFSFFILVLKLFVFLILLVRVFFWVLSFCCNFLNFWDICVILLVMIVWFGDELWICWRRVLFLWLIFCIFGVWLLRIEFSFWRK